LVDDKLTKKILKAARSQQEELEDIIETVEKPLIEPASKIKLVSMNDDY